MSEWRELKKERRGAMPKKAWLTDGEQNALFKPDTPRKHESYFEYEASRIAEALGIPCAKIEVFKHNGKTGTLNYNVQSRGFHTILLQGQVFLQMQLRPSRPSRNCLRIYANTIPNR